MVDLTIALDAMGGDNGPPITIPAALEVLSAFPRIKFIIFGDKYQIEPLIDSPAKSIAERIQIVHCSQTITMGEKPSQALRNKPESSMRKALEAVESGDAQACVTAGNTGALITIAYYVLKMIPGISRPALVTAMPSIEGHKTYLLDLGANVDVDETILHQFALMGSVLAETKGTASSRKPRVALLNVGEEEIKGSNKIKRAAKLIANDDEINYIGYVEGNDIFTDRADVVVCDGYVGNVSLKACEGIAKFVIQSIKEALGKSWISKILAILALPALKKMYKKVNPDQYNGASLLGLRGIVIKSHGNATKDGFRYAIIEAINEIEHKVPESIGNRITALNDRS
ncbi:phosphate acyltransferase PlsX [Algibacillus agarilyticus]|uniref:phosphate acyltransferase PlsX n=1 Tax=Algibacillus agarilyticus TaxID=2234133 RepID=UPI000DD02531|nr:phosphate acyltransferase PlsX [Algibacillus agarilyticus]